jgi:hypothetical protein
MAAVAFLFFLAGTALSVEPQGTTVKREGCLIYLIIQIAVDGTDADVEDVQRALSSGIPSPCYLNCAPPYLLGRCEVQTRIDIRKRSDIPPGDQSKYHQVKIVQDDGLPSSATKQPPNQPSGRGTWRRGRSRKITLHETMHLCGLPDKYCDRWRAEQVVCSTSGVQVMKCSVPPGPADCPCTIAHNEVRCSAPCSGCANDIMSDLGNMTCDHILTIVDMAGPNQCPIDICCLPVALFDLLSLGGIPGPDRIEIRWGVASRDAFIGFHVMRSEGRGAFARASSAMIPNDAASYPAAFSWTDHAVRGGIEYTYGIEAIGRDGRSVMWDQTVVARTARESPASFALRVSGANPFSLEAGLAVSYDVPGAGAQVRIALYDLRGRRVADLLDRWAGGGTHGLIWRGPAMGRLAAGFYVLRMEAGSFRASEGMIFVK